MKLISHLLASMLLVSIIACSPDDDPSAEDIVCVDQAEFCAYVDSSQIDSTGDLITNVLDKLYSESETDILIRLKDYLDCKDCIQSSEIICNSCIDTAPAISELKIEFIISGNIITQILDISMSHPPTFAGYHE